MSDRIKKKAESEVKDTISFLSELMFGDDPEETLAKRVVERGHETSEPFKRVVTKAADRMGLNERPAPQKARPGPPREIAENSDCPGCRVARRNGGKACVEHS